MKYIYLILIVLLCMGKTALAHNDGYIIQADVDDSRLVLVSKKNIISQKLGIYWVETDDELTEFCESYDVEYYEPNVEAELIEVKSTASSLIRWDRAVMKLDDVWDYKLPLNEVNVAIIDTGIASGHEDFDYSRIDSMYNACAAKKILEAGGNIESEENASAINGTEDDIGHGTAVAGMVAADKDNNVGVYGVADGVNLKIYKAFSADCSNVACILASLADIYENHPEIDVVNISIGFTYVKKVNELVSMLAERGVIIVAAAGNNGENADEAKATEVMYPAGCNKAIGVGAIGSTTSIASYSQHNESVDVVAPGTNLKMLYLNNSYKMQSGTSFASPYVTAVAAMVKSVDKEINHDGFLELIKETAEDKGADGYDTYYGWGVISPSKMIDTLADKYGVLLSDESAVVESVEMNESTATYTVKRRNRSFEAFGVNYDENGTVAKVQKRYISGGDGDCIVEFDTIPDTVFWWDSKMQPLFAR